MVLVEIVYFYIFFLFYICFGLCEVIKNVLVICLDEIFFLKQILNKENNYNDVIYWELIYRSILVKFFVMKYDKYERCFGLVLEYGYIVGYVIEYLVNGIIFYGEVVGFGMLVVVEISKKIGILLENDC